MRKNHFFQHPGVLSALGAALLFGLGMPLAKLLLGTIDPWVMAGLLYLGSGTGLTLYRLVTKALPVRISLEEVYWLGGAIFWGGILAPVLLMYGLSHMPAASASLLLNTEGVFTALLAWFAYKENVDRRIMFGMAAIVAASVLLSWPGAIAFGELWPSLAVILACFAWGVDNNLTRKVSLTDAVWIAAAKGLVAGTVNLGLAFFRGAEWPAMPDIFLAMSVGVLAYGASLALFVVGLRHLGTARTAAYFSLAPFLGAMLAVILGEPLTLSLTIAGVLMVFGLWLHLTEHHSHEHLHELIEHEHEHTHDEHHLHAHELPVSIGTTHSHRHRHEPIKHAHPHFPDAHHRHSH